MGTESIKSSQLQTTGPSGIAAWVNKNSLPLYFVLAYALSWAVEIPIALSVQGLISFKVPLAIHYLASFGPMLAALIIVSLTEGRQGIRKLLGGLLRWRVAGGYAFFAIAVPVALFVLAVLTSRLMQGTWPDLGLLAQVDYLPRLGVLPALGLWLMTYGLGEEIGWRGYALPCLQASRSAYTSALLLGALWASWHLPAFFYRDTYISMGLLLGIPMLLISVTAASVTMTWLYNGTQGSLLMAVLFHGLFNFFSVSSAGGPGSPIVMSAVIVFWAVRAIKVYGPATLNPDGKQGW